MNRSSVSHGLVSGLSIGVLTLGLAGCSEHGVTHQHQPAEDPIAPAGTIYHVATGGSDAAAGSATAPFGTVQRALDIAGPGDTVHVGPGTFFGQSRFVNSGEPGAPVVLRGTLGKDGQRLTRLEAGEAVDPETWQPAPEVGPGVWRNRGLAYEPQLMMVDGRLLARVHRRHGRLAMEILSWPEDQVVKSRGTEISFWETIGALYAHHPDPQKKISYLRLGGGGDPREHLVAVSPGGGVITIENISHVQIRDLEIASGDEGVHISGRSTRHVLVDNCLVENARKRINILDYASDVIIRNCEFRMNFYGHATGAWTRGTTAEHARKAYVYFFFKHRHGTATHSDDRSFHIWRGASRILIENNVIHDGVQGIPIENANDIMVRGNTIRNLSSVGTTVGQGSVNVHLDGNHYFNCNINIRLHRLNQNVGHVAWIYRNLLSQPGDAGTHIFCHSVADNPDYVDPRITIYHNTFTMGSRAIGFPAYENMPGGVPGFRFINNVFDAWENYSRTREFMLNPNAVGVFAYTWLGGVKLPPDITPAWFGENVLFDIGARIWSEADQFRLPENHPARNAGIDLSRPFTIAGQEYAPLPGMEPGYFSGKQPDMGAIQH